MNSKKVEHLLTVVVSVCDGASALKRLLADLSVQHDAPEFDLVVVDGTGTVRNGDLGYDWPDTRPSTTTLLCATGGDVAELRSAGAGVAKGRFVAFTEDYCRLPRHWLQAINRLSQNGYRAYGGPIELGSHRSGSDWAAYLVEFGAFMPDRPAGRTSILPGMNCIYERSLLVELSLDTLCEPFVARALAEYDVTMYFEPDLKVIFEHHFNVRNFFLHCVASGQTYARLRLQGSALRRRVTYIAGAVVVLPAALTIRIAKRARTFEMRGALISALPTIALYHTGWSIGEAVGALTAPSAPKQVALGETR